MIGLDTNIIVRYLTQDDIIQAKAANKLFDDCEKAGQIIWISQIVLCELVWVLESSYDQSKKEIINILMQLLQIKHLRIEHQEIVYEALLDYERLAKVDFSDCLISRCNSFNKCDPTFTFDKTAAKLSGFKLLTTLNSANEILKFHEFV